MCYLSKKSLSSVLIRWLSSLFAVIPFLTYQQDDIERLLHQSQPPFRFQGYQPTFEFIPIECAQIGEKGNPETKKFYAIRDQNRYIALYDPQLFQLDVITFVPGKGPETLEIPLVYSWARLLGTRISTCLWIDRMGVCSDRQREEWKVTPQEVILTIYEEWEKVRKATAENQFRLKIHPILGYEWEITTKFKNDQPFTGKEKPVEFLNAQPGNLTSPWPDQWRYDLTIFSGVESGYIGWYNNLMAMDRSNRIPREIRSGGLMGWFSDPEGWGIALVHSDFQGVKSFTKTCNYWGDQHHMIYFPEGKDSFVLKWRYIGIPPELVKEIVQNTKIIDFGKAKEGCIRLGVLEDFEDQPLPLTTVIRGLWTWGLSFSTKYARSGKQSLLIKGILPDQVRWETGRFIAPFIPLDPNSRYRIEAWVYVEGEDTIAYLSDGFPKDEPSRIGTRQTNRATGQNPGWQLVSMERITGDAGGSFDLRFIAIGSGCAYFDDFLFRKVEEIPTR